VIAGLYAASRQFWFVGTDGRGQVTLYQGMPYDLPLGISLYTQKYVSGVPANAIKDRRRRDHDLDQSLRSKGDATDLVRTLQRTYAKP
jgi:PPM family protein phosphatase